MKKLLILSVFCLSLPAFSQEVTYCLPSTTLTVEVEAVREVFFAGPYAPFAKKYLGIDVRKENSVEAYVSQVNVTPRVEADQSVRYSIDPRLAEPFLSLSAQGLVAFPKKADAEKVTWRFTPLPDADFSGKAVTSAFEKETRILYKTVRTDSTFSRVPVQQEVLVEKSLEKRAAEAAEIILKARTERFNIATGNTDATFSGAALGAALDELNRVEQEYMVLFTGYSQKDVQKGSFDVTPSATARDQRYIAFRLSDTEGLVDGGNLSGRPFYLEFETVDVPDPTPVSTKLNSKTRFVYYRIPAVCSVRLKDGSDVLFQTRIPVYQLGRDMEYPLANK